jgi:NO-binding membrane sensor protein with MHYT domain
MYIVYDPTLVMLSILVAILGCLTGVAVTFGYGGARVVLSPQALVRGAVIIGGSIWSMHFIAMLALCSNPFYRCRLVHRQREGARIV